MTFVFPSINGTLKPRERSGHIAAHFDGHLVIWGGYFDVRNLTCFKSLTMGGGWEVVQISYRNRSDHECHGVHADGESMKCLDGKFTLVSTIPSRLTLAYL